MVAVAGPMSTEAGAMPSSRLCVKNIPKHVPEHRIKALFQEHGDVTDCKLLKTKDGLSRQMAFVGFKTAEQAAAAQRYFNRSFLDTSRIAVEFARRVGEEDPEYRPWSKHSKGSSAYQRTHKEEAPAHGKAKDAPKRKTVDEDLQEAIRNDPRLQEFLQVMQPRSAAKLWANDDTDPVVASAIADGAGDKKGSKKTKAPGAPGEAARNGERGRPQHGAASGGEGSGDERESEPKSDQSSSDRGSDDEGAGRETEARELTDAEYLQMRKRAGRWSDDEDAGEASSSDDDEAGGEGRGGVGAGTRAGGAGGGGTDAGGEAGAGEDDDEEEAERLRRELFGGDGAAEGRPEGEAEGGEGHVVRGEDVEGVGSTGRIFVRNLAYTATEEELAEAFGRFGPLVECHLCLDKELRRSKGFAYVTFANPQDAAEAVRGMDMRDFQGRLLHCLPAKRPPKREAGGEEEGKGGYREAKEAKLRADAGNKATWNTLFMRQDTVAEAIAAHYGVTKRELLDRDAADLPVRMALGETWVVAETKRALEEAGVDLAKIEAAAAVSGSASTRKSVARSATALLVKNLPYSVTEEELVALFSKQGSVARLVLPATRTLAVVEFDHAPDARKAFRTLAYKKFQHVPLYLEWAPQGVFVADAPKYDLEAVKARAANAAKTTKPGKAVDVATLAGVDDDSSLPLTSLFVKNLSFGTTDAALLKHFRKAAQEAGGSVRSARVARKKAKTGETLSKGFGFVDVGSEEVARKLLDRMQGSELDGHKLVLQLSRGGKASQPEGPEAVAPGLSKTKLVIRNVAFEASKKELMGLCTPFGHVKELRVPRKFDGTHRGFAFVEYATRQEAQAAMDSLSSAHFYGRHLVVERAKEGEGLEEIRERTAEKFERRSQAESQQGRHAKRQKIA